MAGWYDIMISQHEYHSINHVLISVKLKGSFLFVNADICKYKNIRLILVTFFIYYLSETKRAIFATDLYLWEQWQTHTVHISHIVSSNSTI